MWSMRKDASAPVPPAGKASVRFADERAKDVESAEAFDADLAALRRRLHEATEAMDTEVTWGAWAPLHQLQSQRRREGRTHQLLEEK